MTASELIERARRQLNAPDLEINLAACVMQAKSKVANAVMLDDARRWLLQQAYAVPLNAAGVGDLLAAVGSIAGKIISEGVEFGAVVDADNNRLVPLAHYLSFTSPQSTVFAYYLRVNRTIATRALGVQVNNPADIQGVNGPLSVIASFDPDDVDDFPPELEPDLVQALVEIVSPANA